MSAESRWLRIVTFNTWKGEGRYGQRLKTMAQQLQALQPAVVCLQESLHTCCGSYNTAATIAEALSMHFCFAPARRKIRQVDGTHYPCTSGLAILSRFPLLSHSMSCLPFVRQDSERIAQHALLAITEDLRLSVTNLHLTHLPDADDLRMRQFLVAANLGQHHAKTAMRLCCGDFNFVVDESFSVELSSKTRLLATDCYLAGQGRLPGVTCMAGQPVEAKRIDYIFAFSEPDAGPPVCANSQVVLNQPDEDGHLPSDHAAVAVDLLVNCNCGYCCSNNKVSQTK